MLVLSRHRDEVIRIGDLTSITVVDIRGDKVRLGIEAPREMPVHRQEVYDAIHLGSDPLKAAIGDETLDEKADVGIDLESEPGIGRRGNEIDMRTPPEYRDERGMEHQRYRKIVERVRKRKAKREGK